MAGRTSNSLRHRLAAVGSLLVTVVLVASGCGGNPFNSSATVQGSHLPKGVRVSSEGTPPPTHLIQLSQTFKVTPSGALQSPANLQVHLGSAVPQGVTVVVATSESQSGPWSFLPGVLDGSRTSVAFSTTHFSLLAVLGFDLASAVSDFKTAFLDGLTSGAVMMVAKPSCSSEDSARTGGFTVSSSSSDTVYWCFGMSGPGRVLKVTNNRRYPLEVWHPELTLLQGGKIDWLQLSSLSHWGSGQNTIIAPGDEVTYSVDLPPSSKGGIQTEMDGMGQSLYALETGVTTLISILTRLGVGSPSKYINAAGKLEGTPSCADALGKDAGSMISGCFSPKDLVDAFGTAGIILAPIVATGAVIAFFHSEWNALVDQFNHHDKYIVQLSRSADTAPPPKLGIANWRPDATGYGEIAPTDVNNAGDPTGIISGISWQNWGAAQATGSGTASYQAPGQVAADATPAKATIVAFNLGTCGGVPAYKNVEWYFPEYGQSFNPTNAFEICTPQIPTTTSPSSVTPPCSDSILFPLVAQAAPSVSPTDVPISTTPVTAFCSGGWAVLQHFTVQAGSGNGIALFQQSGDGWRFAQLGDDSGGGNPGYDPCSQYPSAAIQALGNQLCIP